MRNIDEIMERVAHQKAQLQYKGIDAKYLFVDETTYKEMKISSAKNVNGLVVIKTYIDVDKFMGLLVIPLPMIDEFISVGV